MHTTFEDVGITFPSCAQKRTLLIGEYLCEDLLFTLPHR